MAPLASMHDTTQVLTTIFYASNPDEGSVLLVQLASIGAELAIGAITVCVFFGRLLRHYHGTPAQRPLEDWVPVGLFTVRTLKLLAVSAPQMSAVKKLVT
jgi:hypothetical protein